MSKRIGSYPPVRVQGGGGAVVSQAGGVLLLETVRKSGLDMAISAALTPWRKPRAVHDPGKVLLDLALAVAMGGDCLSDVAMLRAEPQVFGPVASDPTVSRLVETLAAAGPRAPSFSPRSRAISATGRPELTTSSTASALYSWVYFFRAEPIVHFPLDTVLNYFQCPPKRSGSTRRDGQFLCICIIDVIAGHAAEGPP